MYIMKKFSLGYSAVMFAVAMMFNTTAFAASKPAKVIKDKNIAVYLKAVNNTARDINEFLFGLEKALSDYRSGNESGYFNGDSGYLENNQIWDMRISEDIPTISGISIKWNQLMANNQKQIVSHLNKISIYAQSVDGEFVKSVGGSYKKDVNQVLYRIRLFKTPYSIACDEMIAYGMKPNVMKIPNNIQDQINKIPNNYNPNSWSSGSVPIDSSGFTYANFQLIDSSYTVDQVNQLFGIDGTLQSEAGQGTNYDLTTYLWQQNNVIVTIMFQNGQETAKDEIGLS